MKKIFVLIIVLILSLESANAGKTVFSDNLAPKIENLAYKDIKKFKTIQKFFDTKLGKVILRKVIKKLQKNQLRNDIKQIKGEIPNIYFLWAILLILGAALIISGFAIGISTTFGIIRVVLGFLLISPFVYLALRLYT